MKESWLKYMLWMLLAAALLEAPSVKCCVEAERLALLEIKAFLTPYSDYALRQFSTWSSKAHNCCAWDSYRIQCNPSGKVMGLDLNDIVMVSNIAPGNITFNVTLFRPFTQLISLDLSYNSIIGLVESNELCKMNNLQEMTLSGNFLSWKHLSCISNLTSLKVVDLFDNNLTGEIPIHSLQRLASLEHLDEGNVLR